MTVMQDDVALLKANRRRAKQQRNVFLRRRNEIDNLKKHLYDMNDYKLSINYNINNCVDCLYNCIRGMNGFNSKADQLYDKKETLVISEQNPYNDAINKINWERNRCSEEIARLNSQIRTLERKIRDNGGTIMPWE